MDVQLSAGATLVIEGCVAARSNDEIRVRFGHVGNRFGCCDRDINKSWM
jgi:hypothetical protein